MNDAGQTEQNQQLRQAEEIDPLRKMGRAY
jgi:hypothetical protein